MLDGAHIEGKGPGCRPKERDPNLVPTLRILRGQPACAKRILC